MLKQRLLTAMILGALVISGVLMLPSMWFSIAVILVLCAAAWEWSRLIGLASGAARASYVAAVAMLVSVFLATERNDVPVFTVLLVASAFWIFAVQRLLRFAGDAELRDGQSLGALSGMLVLVPTGVALVALHRSGEAGPGLVLLLLVLVWAADSGAYFAGKRWGRRKLAPTVSPGKTVEGVCGGLTLAMVAAISGWYVLQPEILALGPAIAISLATVAFSIVGDLYESMLKRQHSVKDSGTLLPGHGGMLDRIDSLTAASPVFALGVLGAGS